MITLGRLPKPKRYFAITSIVLIFVLRIRLRLYWSLLWRLFLYVIFQVLYGAISMITFKIGPLTLEEVNEELSVVIKELERIHADCDKKCNALVNEEAAECEPLLARKEELKRMRTNLLSALNEKRLDEILKEVPSNKRNLIVKAMLELMPQLYLGHDAHKVYAILASLVVENKATARECKAPQSESTSIEAIQQAQSESKYDN